MADFVWTRQASEGGRYNGQLYADGWGTLNIKVVSVRHGISIMSTEDRTRFSKTVYPFRVTDSDFSITVTFTKRKNQTSFSDRLKTYLRQASDPDASVGVMGVLVPSRRFSRFGIPIQGMTYGDKVGKVTYPVTITFTAAEDPLSILQEQDLSKVTNVTEANSMFYPADVGKAAEYALYRGSVDPSFKIPIRGPQ